MAEESKGLTEQSRRVAEAIQQRLVEIDRNKRWLAGKVGRTQAEVNRWVNHKRVLPKELYSDFSLALEKSEDWLSEVAAGADLVASQK